MNSTTCRFWLLPGAVAIAMIYGNLIATTQTPPPGKEKSVSGIVECVDSRSCPAALQYVPLIAGRTYAIEMASADFNARFMLEDINGNLLATDMDYYNDLCGIILFTPPTTGDYRLVVESKNATVGYYHVRFREMAVLMNVETVLTPNDPLVDDTFTSVHPLVMLAGRRYVIDLQSDDFATFLKVLNPEGAVVAFADECDGTRTTRAIFTPTRTATYNLIATSQTPATIGAFRLMVCEE